MPDGGPPNFCKSTRARDVLVASPCAAADPPQRLVRSIDSKIGIDIRRSYDCCCPSKPVFFACWSKFRGKTSFSWIEAVLPALRLASFDTLQHYCTLLSITKDKNFKRRRRRSGLHDNSNQQSSIEGSAELRGHLKSTVPRTRASPTIESHIDRS